MSDPIAVQQDTRVATYLNGAMGSILFSVGFFGSVHVRISLGSVGLDNISILYDNPSLTHSVPFHCVRVPRVLCLDSTTFCGGTLTSKVRWARSKPSAAASRSSCFPISSSFFGLAAGNEVRKSRAFVPLLTSWPRPLLTAVPPGATPPTAHIVPVLTCLSTPSPVFWSTGPRTLPTTKSQSLLHDDG